MNNSVGLEARQRAENYAKALRFLEGLKDFTYADYVKSIRIAGIDMTESEMQQQWKMSEMTIPGTEFLRQTQMDVFREGVRIFSEVAEKFGYTVSAKTTSNNNLKKKWWRFWK